MRDVPIHPDDIWGSPGPIAQEEYNAEGIIELSVGFEDSVSHNLLLGFGFSVMTLGLGTMHERNYTNAIGSETRGEGAALTFCLLEQRGMIGTIMDYTSYLFDLSPQLTSRLVVSHKLDLSLDLTLSYFSVRAFNGWDRFNDYEILDGYTLAHCFPIGIALDSKVYFAKNVRLFAGLQKLNVQRTAKGKETGLKYTDLSWMTGLYVVL